MKDNVMRPNKVICIWLTMFISIFPIKALVTQDLKTSTPEAQGISSGDILAFVEAVEEQVDELHSFMLLRHDRVVAQGWWYPYNPESPHGMASMSKIFTSTAIGMAVDEGLLTIYDPVISFFPGELPEDPSENLKKMRIKDLLTMSTGHVQKEVDAFWINEDKSWVAHFLSQQVTHEPGTHFVYNSHGTYMLSAILQKVSGKTLLEYLQPRLFEPLGIKDPTWEKDPQGINLGGWGLNVKTEDVAKLGLLYLRKGIWKGERLLSEHWVDQATSLQTSNGSDPHNDWNQGYGYQFWRCRHNIYRGDGAAGQFCIVMPDQDAVLAITAGVSDMQLVMDLVWEHFLPAMKKAPLQADEKAYTALKTKLDNLALKELEGERTSEIGKVISGRTFICESNPMEFQKITLTDKTDVFHLMISNNEDEFQFNCGRGKWEKGGTPFTINGSEKVAALGAWTAPETYMVKLQYYETSIAVVIKMQFAEDDLLMDLQMKPNANVIQIKGRMEAE